VGDVARTGEKRYQYILVEPPEEMRPFGKHNNKLLNSKIDFK
jgi:hypothetical protein